MSFLFPNPENDLTKTKHEKNILGKGVPKFKGAVPFVKGPEIKRVQNLREVR